jgi:lipopolysaccharide transport system ATP-binding protein
MSRSLIVHAEGLGKQYLIGHQAERERYVTLRDVIHRTVSSIWRRTGEMARGRAIVAGDVTEEVWAIRNLDFGLRQGEVVGIIGHNGAGKSTLLKILSRITEPSEGRVTIKGRVASLLEVGTGFHPELTGRENIYLNGAILGMTRREIRAKFDEIVDFSGQEKFLDTPVKRYSSGMSVRLAFAVAAHLEPEILIVDEVLAVGDAEFQRKCIGKMQDVSAGGRTVLFVSHNMAAVRALCGRVLLMKGGRISFDGEPEAAISTYLSDVDADVAGKKEWSWVGDRGPGGADVRVRKVRLVGEHSNGLIFRPDEEIRVEIEYEQTKPLSGMRFVLRLVTMNGEIAFGTTDESVRGGDAYPAGKYITRCTIPRNLLNCMPYLVRINAIVPPRTALVEPYDVGRLVVDGIPNDGAIARGPSRGAVLSPKMDWSVEPLGDQGMKTPLLELESATR